MSENCPDWKTILYSSRQRQQLKNDGESQASLNKIIFWKLVQFLRKYDKVIKNCLCTVLCRSDERRPLLVNILAIYERRLILN